MESLKDNKYEEFYRNVLKEKILHLLKDVTENKELNFESNILNEFGREVNVGNEINEYVEVMSSELINDLANIDNKINEWFANYEKIKHTNEKTILIDIENSNKILDDISKTKKELEQIEENFIKEIDTNNNYDENKKEQHKKILKLLIENIKKVLNELVKQFHLEIDILKYKL